MEGSRADEEHGQHLRSIGALPPTAEETLRYATSISVGRDGDEDRRPFVLVARQYGSTSFPLRPWTVFDVTYDAGVHNASKLEFDDQYEAIRFAWHRLPVLRAHGVLP